MHPTRIPKGPKTFKEPNMETAPTNNQQSVSTRGKFVSKLKPPSARLMYFPGLEMFSDQTKISLSHFDPPETQNTTPDTIESNKDKSEVSQETASVVVTPETHRGRQSAPTRDHQSDFATKSSPKKRPTINPHKSPASRPCNTPQTTLGKSPSTKRTSDAPTVSQNRTPSLNSFSGRRSTVSEKSPNRQPIVSRNKTFQTSFQSNVGQQTEKQRDSIPKTRQSRKATSSSNRVNQNSKASEAKRNKIAHDANTSPSVKSANFEQKLKSEVSDDPTLAFSQHDSILTPSEEILFKLELKAKDSFEEPIREDTNENMQQKLQQEFHSKELIIINLSEFVPDQKFSYTTGKIDNPQLEDQKQTTKPASEPENPTAAESVDRNKRSAFASNKENSLFNFGADKKILQEETTDKERDYIDSQSSSEEKREESAGIKNTEVETEAKDLKEQHIATNMTSLKRTAGACHHSLRELMDLEKKKWHNRIFARKEEKEASACPIIQADEKIQKWSGLEQMIIPGMMSSFFAYLYLRHYACATTA